MEFFIWINTSITQTMSSLKINKILVLKLVLEKKSVKTYIGGLNEFIDGSEIKNFTKKLQEHLNSKLIKRKVDDEIECGVDGNCIESIRQFALTNLSLSESNIQVQDETLNDTEDKIENLGGIILDKINKKITLNSFKEKRTTKTYLVGLSDFLSKEEMNSFGKKLQKKLGTSFIVKENGDCGFSGDYTSDSSKKNKIRDFIVKNTDISKDLIQF